MEVEFKVKQEHIDNGHARKCYSCPVALAIDEVFPGSQPFVTHDIIGFDKLEWRNLILDTPQTVDDFITAFDTDSSVSPFSFTLDIPDRYLVNRPLAPATP